MRLPPGLCPGPRRGCLQRPQNPSGDTSSHTLAKGPTELRAPGPRDPTIRHCLGGIISNCTALESTWDEAKGVVPDTEIKREFRGFALYVLTEHIPLQVPTVSCWANYFGNTYSDNLSRSLQHKSLSAAGGQRVHGVDGRGEPQRNSGR